MRKLFESGWAFMIVALLCFGTGAISDNGAAFIGFGVLWLVVAIAVRGKNAKRNR
jgi:hypothetical protein